MKSSIIEEIDCINKMTSIDITNKIQENIELSREKNIEILMENTTSFINMSYLHINENPSDDIAMYNLGYLYHTKQEYDRSIEWYTKSSLLGNSYAMNDIGYYYSYYEKNIDKSIEWYNKSISLNNFVALYNLGTVYGDNGNYDKAEEYLIKSALLGYSHAIDSLFELIDIDKKYIENIDEKIISIMSDEQKKIYNEYKKSCIKLKKIYGTFSDDCIICYEKLLNTYSGIDILVCGHMFHKNCVSECINCPICKMEIIVPNNS